VLTLVALAVMFSGEFNRRGQWKRIALSAVIGAALLFASVGVRGAMATQTMAVPIAYLLLFAPTIIALFILMDRAKRFTPYIAHH